MCRCPGFLAEWPDKKIFLRAKGKLVTLSRQVNAGRCTKRNIMTDATRPAGKTATDKKEREPCTGEHCTVEMCRKCHSLKGCEGAKVPGHAAPHHPGRKE